MRLSSTRRWAVAFAVVGLLGQVAQILLVRFQFALTDANLVPRVVVEERVPRPAFRFEQIRQAMRAAAAVTPPGGIVQSDPHARLHNVFLLYTERQMAAADDGCNFPFGGDPRKCLPMSRDIIALFGGMGPRYQGAPKIFNERIGFDPSLVTPSNFERVCSLYKLDTVVASYLDPAWWDRSSWIWQLRPSFRNATARVFPCAQPIPPPETRFLQTPTQPVN